MNQTAVACELLEVLGGADIVVHREPYLHADNIMAHRAMPGRLFCGARACERMALAFRAVDELLERCNLTRGRR